MILIGPTRIEMVARVIIGCFAPPDRTILRRAVYPSFGVMSPLKTRLVAINNDVAPLAHLVLK